MVELRTLDPAILLPAPPSDADPVALSLQQMHSRPSLKPVTHFAFRFQVNAMGFSQSDNRFHYGRLTIRKFVSGVDGLILFIHPIPDELQQLTRFDGDRFSPSVKDSDIECVPLVTEFLDCNIL